MERIHHKWDSWECYPSGFFNNKPENMKKEEGEQMYREFLAQPDKFACTLTKVLLNWPNSCEHNLSNESMNRIAWLGQAAMCYEYGIPSMCRGGYNLLTESQKEKADGVALQYLNNWLISKGFDVLDSDSSKSKTVANHY